MYKYIIFIMISSELVTLNFNVFVEIIIPFLRPVARIANHNVHEIDADSLTSCVLTAVPAMGAPLTFRIFH